MDEFHPGHSTIPLYVKTFANSTLPEDTEVSETSSKRHDKQAASSHSTVSSQLSSRTNSSSSDNALTSVNGFGNVKRRGSKNRGNVLTKGDKKTSSWQQRNDASRSSAPSVLDSIKRAVESTAVIQTSAVATNTKSTTSTLSSSGKQAWMHGRNLIPSGATSITSRQPQAADIPDGHSSSSNNTPVSSSNHALHKRRTSAPVFSSRLVSTGVNYAASVKANLPSVTTTATGTQQPSSPLDTTSPTASYNASSTIATLPTTNATNTANSTLTSEGDSSTCASHTSACVSTDLPTTDSNKATGPQNLVTASESINLILQDLDSAVSMRKAVVKRGKQVTVTEPPCVSEVMNNSMDVLNQDWESIDMSLLSSNDCNNADDKTSEFLFCV